MNSRTSTRAKIYTSFLVFLFSVQTLADWEIDLSRRRRETTKKVDAEQPAAANGAEQALNFADKVLPTQVSGQDFVILNTEKGFLPQTLHLKSNQTYTIHVVNVNDKEKNTSFIMDEFKESHSTYYGEIKTFTITPKTDGIFTFICPETAIEGKMIVYSEGKTRSVAAEKE